MALILLVDDDELILETTSKILMHAGHEVLPAPDAEKAHALLAGQSPDLALVDVMLPGKGGLSFIMESFGADSACKVVVMSGKVGVGLESFRGLEGHFGVRALLQKPFGAAELLDAVNAALVKACV